MKKAIMFLLLIVIFGCSDEPKIKINTKIPKVFDDTKVQEAYEACVDIDFKLTLLRNPGITQATFDRVAPQALETCESMLRSGCMSGDRRDTRQCEELINGYIERTVKFDDVEVRELFKSKPWWKFW